jgi:hypothetical protein
MRRLMTLVRLGPNWAVTTVGAFLMLMAVTWGVPYVATGHAAPVSHDPRFSAVNANDAAPSFGFLVFLPIVKVPVVVNGDFDSGLASWSTGGVLGVSWTSNGGSPTGGGAALLGSPTWDSQCLNVPVGNAYIAQTITVPNASNATLSFSYHILTQDWTGSTDLSKAPPLYDWLGVYANQLDDAHHLFYAGNTDQGKGTGCAEPYDMGWTTSPSISLANYQGKQITLYFVVWNEGDTYYNTYAYVDGVSVTGP